MFNSHGNLYKGGGVGIKGYFYMLLVTSVCGSVCALISSGRFEKYIKYIVSLICVAVIVSPFRDIDIKGIAEKAEAEFSFAESSENLLYKTSGEMTEERTQAYINEIILSEFGIKPIATHIEIDWGKEEPIIENIKVYLSSADYPQREEVENYLYTVLGGEVEIIEG